MDNTILTNVAQFIGTSIASQLTWELVKSGALKISFIKKFRKFFNNDDRLTEEYIKEISTKKSLSEKRPFNDIRSIYENLTNTDMPEQFNNCISEWIKQNEHNFNIYAKSQSTFNIRNQISCDSSTINNINTQNNYK
ncbi:hypothetical protein [Clostridium tyrobutyricum]|uniref:hypothetical protein n=1 Tax=Clostridium tyrobutyricum TaxID=1519 RepID=UPI0011CB2100|nr:hypothetical protein [Clostridium tyrobutyricum]